MQTIDIKALPKNADLSVKQTKVVFTRVSNNLFTVNVEDEAVKVTKFAVPLKEGESLSVYLPLLYVKGKLYKEEEI